MLLCVARMQALNYPVQSIAGAKKPRCGGELCVTRGGASHGLTVESCRVPRVRIGGAA